jgi:hypothetical protein
MTEPTPGEMMRRLDEVAAQMLRILAEIASDRKRAEQLYVLREAWALARDADKGRVHEVEKDIDQLKKDRDGDLTYRRQILLALAIASLSAIVSTAIAIFAFLVR